MMMERFLLCFWGNMKERNKKTFYLAFEFGVLTIYETYEAFPETVKTKEDKKGWYDVFNQL